MSDALTAAAASPQESATQPVEEERLGGTPLLNPEKVAEVERAAAEKALDEFENELVTREMPEAGAHINMTPYREGKIDGVNRAAIAAARRAEAYRQERGEQ